VGRAVVQGTVWMCYILRIGDLSRSVYEGRLLEARTRELTGKDVYFARETVEVHDLDC
jgi:hypothetical protein